MNKRILLTLLTAGLLLTSCGNAATVTETTDETGDTTVEMPAETVDPITEAKNDYYSSIGTVSAPGVEIMFLSETDDVAVEEETGEKFNDAVWYRNIEVEDRLNVKISHEARDNDGSTAKTLTNNVLAGDGTYDAATVWTHYAASMIASNTLLDLNTIPHLQMDQKWWNQIANKNMSLAGKQYVALSSLNHYADSVAEMVMMNKDMCINYNMDIPYDAVKEGKWTYDMMWTMMNTLPQDSNGDGNMDTSDIIGLVTQTADIDASMVSCGVDFFAKNDKDIPEFILNSEINVDKFNTIFNIYNDKTRTVTVQKDIKEDPWHYWEFKFKEGEALFLMNFPCNLYAFVEMEQDFSILPMPKYNEAQETYRTMTSVWYTSCIVTPKVFDADPGDIGLVIDALSFLSYVDVEPTFVAAYLEQRWIRDPESAEMMTIALENKYYDPGFLMNFQWGTAIGIPSSLVTAGKDNFVSTVVSKAATIEKAIEKTITNIE